MSFECRRECQFGAVLPRPSAEAIQDFYVLDSYYTQGRSHFADAGHQSFLDKLRVHLAWRLDFGWQPKAETIHELLGGQPSEICDIGCGGGDLAARLGDLGHRVVGVEIDPRAAEQARSRGVEVHEGTAEQLPDPVASKAFDLVIMFHVLEHCLDPVRAFENASRLLRSKGLFLCEVPNNASMGLESAGVAWEPLDIPRHLNFFVPRNLVMLAKALGLEPKELYYRGFCRQFSNQWINTERRIGDAILRAGGEAVPFPARNSGSRAWKLLARSAWASKERKYDAVGIIAARP